MLLILPFSYLTAFAFGPAQYEDNHLYYIANARSGKYLTVNGNNIEQSSNNYTQYQRFFVRKAQTINGQDYYFLVPDSENAKRIDVANALDQNGANIGLYTKRTANDTLIGAQQFQLYTVENSIDTRELVNSTKHLNYNTENSYKSYVENARDTWNGYIADVIRKYIPIIRPATVSIVGDSFLEGATGLTDYANQTIKISTTYWANLTEDQKKNVILHEIGHALGIGHIDESNAVMYYANTQNLSLTYNDTVSYSMSYSRY